VYAQDSGYFNFSGAAFFLKPFWQRERFDGQAGRWVDSRKCEAAAARHGAALHRAARGHAKLILVAPPPLGALLLQITSGLLLLGAPSLIGRGVSHVYCAAASTLLDSL